MKQIFFLILIFSKFYIIINFGAESEKKKIVHIGYSVDLFNEVDINDALVAIQLWSDKLVEQFNDKYTVKNSVYRNIKEIIDAYYKNEIDIISLLSVTYFELPQNIKIIPLLSSTQAGIEGYEYIVLSRKDNQIRNIYDLENNSIVFIPNNYSKVSELWLKSKINFANLEKYFSMIIQGKKPSQAILSVFFKNYDATLVPYFTFETMIELNPQVKNELHIIEKSPPLLNAIVCIRENLEQTTKEDFLKFTQSLTISNSGQLLTSLFGVIELKPYDEETFKRTKKIFDDCGDKYDE